MILVTGGTGFIGAHLLYGLCEKALPIRAIKRESSSLKEVEALFKMNGDKNLECFKFIEWVNADITDIPALEDAFVGVTEVYHSAAIVSFNDNDEDLMRKINIEGTANVVNLSLAFGVSKFCFISSISTLDPHKNKAFVTEEAEWNTELDRSIYAFTKHGAELEVWRGIHEGLNAVIVNPGVVFGHGFWDGQNSSIYKTVEKGLKFYTEGVTGYVGVTDVVEKSISLMNKNCFGERFVLVSESLSFKNVLELIAEQLNVKAPTTKAKSWLLVLAWRLDYLKCKLVGSERKLTKRMALAAVGCIKYDSSKVKELLNSEFTPIKDVLKHTLDYYKKKS